MVYGSDIEQSAGIASELNRLGHRSLIYDDLAEWVADIELPLERLPNYQKLVHPEWVSQLLSGNRPEKLRR